MRGPSTKPWDPANFAGRTEKESDEERVASKVGGNSEDSGNSKKRENIKKEKDQLRDGQQSKKLRGAVPS